MNETNDGPGTTPFSNRIPSTVLAQDLFPFPPDPARIEGFAPLPSFSF